jgi:hypothetical protein
LALALVSAVALIVAAFVIRQVASASPGRTVTFEVTGGGSAYSVDTDPSVGRLTDVSLPWSDSATIGTDETLLQVVVVGKDGSPGCRIKLDGKVLAEKPTGGDGHCVATAPAGSSTSASGSTSLPPADGAGPVPSRPAVAHVYFYINGPVGAKIGRIQVEPLGLSWENKEAPWGEWINVGSDITKVHFKAWGDGQARITCGITVGASSTGTGEAQEVAKSSMGSLAFCDWNR